MKWKKFARDVRMSVSQIRKKKIKSSEDWVGISCQNQPSDKSYKDNIDKNRPIDRKTLFFKK